MTEESTSICFALDLAELAAGIPDFTTAKAITYAESASVCLSHHNHEQGVRLLIGKGKSATVQFFKITQQMRDTYCDLNEATEDGACGLAIMIVRALTGLQVIQRSWRGTGFDFSLGNREAGTFPFQKVARLEVSGLLSGSENQIRARVTQKTNQTRLSDDTKLKAYVVVVEFGRPCAVVVER